MNRRWYRLGEAVFDEADLHRRTAELAGFVDTARDRYGLQTPIAVGVSNGVNIAMTHRVVPAGHGLSQAELTSASAWVKNHA